MSTALEVSYLLAAIGGGLTLLSNVMKRMVPLRIFALASNSFLLAHAGMDRDWINVALQIALLGVNGYRLWDLQRLLVALEQASADTPLKDWLLPYMKRKNFKAGDVLFTKGDPAHHMIYIRKGKARLADSHVVLGAGSLVGEIGLFTADRKRTATVVCDTACVCYTMTDEAIYLLYYQNPKLGFYLIRLIVQRLLEDTQRRPAVATT